MTQGYERGFLFESYMLLHEILQRFAKIAR